MTQPQPPLLAYAAQDVHAERFSRPFVIWTIAMGLMVLAGVAMDVAGPGSIGQLLGLRNIWRTGGVDAITKLVRATRFLLPCLAAPFVVIAVLITWRQGWEISPIALRLLRIAAVVILLNAAIQLIYAPYWMLEIHRRAGASYPFLQNLFNTLASMVTALIPAVLLTAASMRRFHARPTIPRRLVRVLVIAWAIPICLLFTDQMIRWMTGTPPGWLVSTRPGGWGGLSLGQQRVLVAYQIAMPLKYYLAAWLMLFVGIAGLAMQRWRVGMLWTIAVTFLLTTLASLGFYGLLLWFNRMNVSSLGNMLVSNAFQLLLSAAALMGAVREPEPPPLPMP